MYWRNSTRKSIIGYKILVYGYNHRKWVLGGNFMIILDRETIIDGLIELRNEEEQNNKIIIDNITRIIRKKNVSDIDKLKMINNEIGKILIIWKGVCKYILLFL